MIRAWCVTVPLAAHQPSQQPDVIINSIRTKGHEDTQQPPLPFLHAYFHSQAHQASFSEDGVALWTCQRAYMLMLVHLHSQVGDHVADMQNQQFKIKSKQQAHREVMHGLPHVRGEHAEHTGST